MIGRPGVLPDIHLLPHDVPKRFVMPLVDENGVIDMSESTVTVIVEDNALEVGTLSVDMTDLASGELWLTVDQAVYDAVGYYSTWRLREAP